VSNDAILAFGLLVSVISFVGAYIFFRIQLEQEASDFNKQKQGVIADSDPTKARGTRQQGSAEASD
jgi:hypothetical protein